MQFGHWVVVGFWATVGLLPADSVPAFQQSADEVDVYDFVELTARFNSSPAPNPFRDVAVSGRFEAADGNVQSVDGFCDDAEGKIFRCRFMPLRPGAYRFSLHIAGSAQEWKHTGTFHARAGKRKGPVRIDRENPWHFVFEGTGEHYLWNGTTTYYLLGWDDISIINSALDRLAKFKINRIRVALNGRTPGGERWYEPNVVNTHQFKMRLNPWLAGDPDSLARPGFDVSRYNTTFWQKCDAMLRQARAKGIQVSLLFYLDGVDPGVDPFGKAKAGGPDEKAYYRYAVARCAPFANVMWDVTNEYHLFRTERWVNEMGTYLKSIDPYKHLTSVHGHADYKFRTQPWSDFVMYQSWDEHGGHAFMLKARAEQAKTGRPIPQVNEEYGYEDHYPAKWGEGRKPPARSADNRRRLAWEMVLAGGYQTTGERADQGTGRGSDTGGGWINGRGDDKMIMLAGYEHLVDCLTSLAWWKMNPHDELVSAGNFCLAEPGRQYLVYLPKGGRADVHIEPGVYTASWFNPRTGERKALGHVEGGQWQSPPAADAGDWAIILQR